MLDFTPPCDPICYSVNTRAIGDMIAAAPIVKWAVETYHVSSNAPYKVVISPYFRDFFHFIPDENILSLDEDWKFDRQYAVRRLNDLGKYGVFSRLTAARLSLSEYARITLLLRLDIPTEATYYVPFNKESSLDTPELNLDFSKTVIFSVTYKDANRSWNPEEILKLAAWVKGRGYTPAFVGKLINDIGCKITPQSMLPDHLPEFILDLRNKTSLLELYIIMKRCKAVVGIDSGPIHLAGMTETDIVCGYTTIIPEHRMPLRPRGVTLPVVPDVSCRFCSTRWNLDFFGFNSCYHGHTDCVKQMTADRFIVELSKIL